MVEYMLLQIFWTLNKLALSIFSHTKSFISTSKLSLKASTSNQLLVPVQDNIVKNFRVFKNDWESATLFCSTCILFKLVHISDLSPPLILKIDSLTGQSVNYNKKKYRWSRNSRALLSLSYERPLHRSKRVLPHKTCPSVPREQSSLVIICYHEDRDWVAIKPLCLGSGSRGRCVPSCLTQSDC